MGAAAAIVPIHQRSVGTGSRKITQKNQKPTAEKCCRCCLASTVVSWGQCAQGLAGRVNDARSTQQRNACPLGRASVAHSRANGDTVAAGVENTRESGIPTR